MKGFEKIIEELEAIGQECTLLKRSDIEKQKELFQKLFQDVEYMKTHVIEINEAGLERLIYMHLNLDTLISNLYTLKEEIEVLSSINPDSKRHAQSVKETIASLEDSHESLKMVIGHHPSVEE